MNHQPNTPASRNEKAVAKTDREWFDFCRPFIYMNGSHEMPNYAAICRAVLALAAPEAAIAARDMQRDFLLYWHKDVPSEYRERTMSMTAHVMKINDMTDTLKEAWNAWQACAGSREEAPAASAQPMFYASAEQANALQDRPDDGEGGVYLPLRKTAAGKFTMPLYTAPSEALSPATVAQPVEWQYRTRPTWQGAPGWGDWMKCSEGAAQDYIRTPLLHQWAYEVRALYAAQPCASQGCGGAEALHAVMKGVEEMLNKAYEHWDADREMKVGKILLALTGENKGYDKRSDAWCEALAEHPKEGS